MANIKWTRIYMTALALAFLISFIDADYLQSSRNLVALKSKGKREKEKVDPEAEAEGKKGCPGCCTLGNLIIHDNHMEYVQGQPLENGSIYVVCKEGTPSCYRDQGYAELPGEPSPCPSMENSESKSSKSNLFYRDMLWEKGVVCYKGSTIEPMSGVHPTQRLIIYKAMDHIEENTKVRFVELKECISHLLNDTEKVVRDDICGGCMDYIHFQLDVDDASMCSSPIGRKRGENLIRINQRHLKEDVTMQKGDIATILHALGHAIGLLHEHQHPEATSLFYLSNSIPVELWNQYAKYSALPAYFISKKYDPDSIMHYLPREGECQPKKRCPVFRNVPTEFEGYVQQHCTPANVDLCTFNSHVNGDHNTGMTHEEDCTLPEAIHCETDPKEISGPVRNSLSAGDIEVINTIYENPPWREPKPRATVLTEKNPLGDRPKPTNDPNEKPKKSTNKEKKSANANNPSLNAAATAAAAVTAATTGTNPLNKDILQSNDVSTSIETPKAAPPTNSVITPDLALLQNQNAQSSNSIETRKNIKAALQNIKERRPFDSPRNQESESA